MNADPADTRYPHLDLGDLIAGAAGQPMGDRAREHLAGCEDCRREATRWNLVAGGVRGLAAAAPGAAQPVSPRHTRRRVPAGPWRRAMVVAGSAAAALVLLVGIGEVTGYVHVHLSGPGTQTALAAVIGCTELQQADGTLEQVNGSSLVIKTASGQPVTVTTTATTFMSMSGALLSDITDGASVVVRGDSSDGTIAAAIVTVGQPFSAVNPAGFVPVQGTVADASTAGFTLVTSGGARVPVTTSSGTLVVIPHASPGQLQAGASIFAVGQAGPGGTLLARGVAAVSQLASGPRLFVSVKVKDCSPSSIEEALGAISVAPVSAG
ncbi:MAG: anti-sigma factor family protein [Streptosporangiaceae bacterium]